MAVGLASFVKSKKTVRDYLIADQSAKAWQVGLSAVSTKYSSYMFTGMLGYTYLNGFSSFWLIFLSFIGQIFSVSYIFRRVPVLTKKGMEISYSGLVAGGAPYLSKIISFISLFFLSIYTAAQFKAGGKILLSAFGWDMIVGLVFSALIIVAYSFAGGVRATLWTDIMQSLLMIFVMIFLPLYAIWHIGGLGIFYEKIAEISDSYLSLSPKNTDYHFFFGPLLFGLGWIWQGATVVTQPHIVSRVMMLREKGNFKEFQFYYFGYSFLFPFAAFVSGLCARVLVPDLVQGDAELGFIRLAQELLHPVITGMIVAGIFAAIMSTSDSQVLTCTGGVINDFVPKKFQNSYPLAKLVTILIVCLCGVISVYGGESVFHMILLAWNTMASAFGGVFILRVWGKRIPEAWEIGMVFVGISVSSIWWFFGLHKYVISSLPGVLIGFVPYLIYRLRRRVY